MPKKRAVPLTLEEKRAKQREYQRRYTEKKALEQGKPLPRRLVSSDSPTIPDATDPATIAALINQRFGYSQIIGEYHRGGKTVIAERLKHTDSDTQRFRLKVTVYTFFSSEGELKNYTLKNKIPIQYN